jgi:hypothetical protein
MLELKRTRKHKESSQTITPIVLGDYQETANIYN